MLVVTRILLTIFLTALPFNYADAQDSIELPDIKGTHIIEYKELKIEITGIQRLRSYQPYWHKSDRVRGNKIVARPGFEIALVRVHTTRLAANRGIKLSHLYLFDNNGKRFEGDLISIFFLGSRSSAESDPKENAYEFPVTVAEGTRFVAVQFRQFTESDTRPFFVFQNLFFDIGKFDW